MSLADMERIRSAKNVDFCFWALPVTLLELSTWSSVNSYISFQDSGDLRLSQQDDVKADDYFRFE